MRNVKIERLPSGSFRVRKQISGHKIQLVFDHRPSQSEVIKALSEQADTVPVKGSFEYFAHRYIEIKTDANNPLTSPISASTVKGYTSILKALPKDFRRKELAKITQADVQEVITVYSANHKAKTTANLHGFISAVLNMFNPSMVLHTKLPQKDDFQNYIPTQDEVARILDASKVNPAHHIAFMLGCMSLRRSEVCALQYTDIKEGNILRIDKALVQDVNHNWIVKKPKTPSGCREIFIPDSLIQEIFENRNESGKILDCSPNAILKALHSYQRKLQIREFRFHDLRHYFASFAHKMGVSDQNILSTGGWRSIHTLKAIYQHEMGAFEEQKRIFDSFVSDDEKNNLQKEK